MNTPLYIGVIVGLMTVAMILYRRYSLYRQKYLSEATITYFATSLFGKNTVDDILWDVAKNCISRLHFEDCVIYLVDEDRQVLMQKAAYGPKNPVRFEIQHPIEIPIGKGITGTVALTGQPEIIADTSKDARYIVDDERRLAEITIPLFCNGKVIGVIDSEHSQKAFFNVGHQQVLEKIAAICSAKIAQTQAEERSRQQTEEVRLLQQQLAEFRLVNLKSQMNPHFLFNCLNGIYNSIVIGETQKAQDYVTNFARLLRTVIIHAEKNFISLQEEIDLLQYYLKIESLRTDHAFEYTFEIDPQISPGNCYVPGMLIQPFLENAIWHGLMNKAHDRHLLISWKQMNNKVLLCEITDNGVGRLHASRISSKGLKSSEHQSKGMALCQERIDLYKSLFNTQFQIQIADIENEINEPMGTKVSITFETENNLPD
jgi:two-component system LytT family sensor kinase